VAQEVVCPVQAGVSWPFLKVYVIGDHVWHYCRGCVSADCAVSPSPEPSFHAFDSQKSSPLTVDPPAQQQRRGGEGEGEEQQHSEELLHDQLHSIAKAIRYAVPGLSMFGYDAIVEKNAGGKEGEYTFYVLDVNYYPSYTGWCESHELIMQHTKDLYAVHAVTKATGYSMSTPRL
jgi:hypothetical protein